MLDCEINSFTSPFRKGLWHFSESFFFININKLLLLLNKQENYWFVYSNDYGLFYIRIILCLKYANLYCYAINSDVILNFTA
jgi:hypothetical protein